MHSDKVNLLLSKKATCEIITGTIKESKLHPDPHGNNLDYTIYWQLS